VSVRTRYDDGGFSGGNLERPALQNLITDIRAGRIDVTVDAEAQAGGNATLPIRPA
jgi:DNA invertase Pin-like site-specific DNA recombinase